VTNIVLYFYSLSKSGGAERRICQLANELEKKKYKVFLCSLDEPGTSSYYPLAEGVTWWQLGRKKNGLYDKVSRIVRLYLALRKNKVNILIGFVMSGDKTIFLSAKFARIRLIVAERNSPKMYWIRLSFIQRWVVFAFMHLADRITIQMPEFISQYPRSLHKRLITIPNPVPQAKNLSNPSIPNQEDRFILLAVSRLDNLQKRIDLLVRSFHIIADDFRQWNLQIIGSGEDREQLRKLITEKELDQRIQLIEAKKNIFKYYEHAHLFVIPSRWEGFPNALAEAMSHGLPAVGFAESSGVAELIGHGGWLAEGNSSVESLAEALRRAMSNPEERRQKGETGKTFVQSFTPEKHINQWDKLIKLLLS